jgi:hypothetical protein
MDLNRLSLSDRIIGGAGLALVIDLLFVPWHNFDLGVTSATRAAWQSPNGFGGVFALLLTLAVLALGAVTRFTTTVPPELPLPLNRVIFFATIGVLAVLLIKLISETESLSIGAYLGILLAAGLAYGGFLGGKEPVAT